MYLNCNGYRKEKRMTHIPQRMCVACRQMLPKTELIRLTAEDGAVVLDNNQKKSGRGAYICKKEECIDKARKRRILSAKFKKPVPEKIYDELRGVLDG